MRTKCSNLLTSQETLSDSQVPKLFRETGLKCGYRKPYQSIRYYLASIFQIHNETVNIWTHLIGCFVIWFVIAEYHKILDFWSNKQSWSIMILGICVIITHLLSTIAHIFNSKSEKWNYNCWMIDYMGCNIYGFGSGIEAFYIHADKSTYEQFEFLYLPMLLLAALLSYFCLCYAKVRYGLTDGIKRKWIMVCGYMGKTVLTMRMVIPRYIDCYYDNECSMFSLNHIVLVYLLFVLQAVFFASHIPERFYPGKFDIVGQGHQIFHVVFTMAACGQFKIMLYDIQTGHAIHTEPDMIYILLYTIILVLAQIIVMLVMKRYIPSTIKTNKTT